MGIGGFLIPLVSIAAAMTLQPALLSLYGRRGVRRAAFVRRERDSGRRGYWERLAAAIMRRPIAFLAAGSAVLLAAAVPVFGLQLTPGSAQGIPQHPQAIHGFDVLRRAVGAGALSTQSQREAATRTHGLTDRHDLGVGPVHRDLTAEPRVEVQDPPYVVALGAGVVHAVVGLVEARRREEHDPRAPRRQQGDGVVELVSEQFVELL